MKKIILLLCVVLSVTCLVFTASCGNTENDGGSFPNDSSSSSDSSGGQSEVEVPLVAPRITLNEDYSVSWEEVDGASAYTVNLNGEDLAIKTTLCSVAQYTDAGEYKIKVKAVRGTEETSYSNEVGYSVYKVEFPSSQSCKFTGEKTVYSGRDYTFSVEELSDKYDYSSLKVFVNGTETKITDGKVTVKNVSENISVTITEPAALTVYNVSKINGEGYDIIGKNYAVKGKPYTFTIDFADGVVLSKVKVFAGGNLVTPENGVYTVKNVSADFDIQLGNVTFSGEPETAIYLKKTWKDVTPTISNGNITVSAQSFALPTDWVMSLINGGYTHLTFKATADSDVKVSSADTVLKTANAEDFVFRIDLSNVSSYDITVTSENATEVGLSEFNLYKYTEEWTKTNPLAYVCEENGELVVDTYGCGDGVAVYKDDFVYAEGGSNAVIVDENGSVKYVYAAVPSVITPDEAEFYAVASESASEKQIRLMVLKDDGAGRATIRIKKSLEYAKTSPFVTLSFNSQSGETVKYVYGDLTVDKKTYNVFEKTEFACDITTEAYKTTAFGFYADRSDAGVVITATFAENTLENEFLTSKVWTNLNGGTATIEDDRFCVSRSWQTNINVQWLKDLKAAGYTTLEFDVKLVSGGYFQAQWRGKEPYFKADGKGVAHVVLDLTDETMFLGGVQFRVKTKDGTAYGNSIDEFDVEYYNVVIK